MRNASLSFSESRPKSMRLFGKRAAIPATSVHDTNLVRTLVIDAPGAEPVNTEVCWDEAAQTLWVGVWNGRPPPWLRLPLRFPVPELAWLKSFYMPGHAGDLAKASVAAGRIKVQVPTKLAPNVVPFKAREATRTAEKGAAPQPVGPSSPLMATCRWLGIASGVALCLPIFLFSMFLFGFLLLPLLPLIGAALVASTGGSPSAPPARPRLPSAAAAARAFEQGRAA